MRQRGGRPNRFFDSAVSTNIVDVANPCFLHNPSIARHRQRGGAKSIGDTVKSPAEKRFEY